MCDVYDLFNFCLVNDKYIIGDNSTNRTNALISGKTCPETLIIPAFIKGHKIEEIGCNAFSFCNNIKTLIIRARITQINEFAFQASTSLTTIYLPSTLRYIFQYGIHIWNESKGSGKTTPGITNIYIEKNSRLSYMGFQGISYKEFVYINTCEAINPVTHQHVFGWTNKVYTVAPVIYTIRSSQSIVSPNLWCIYGETVANPHTKCSNRFLLCIILVLLS